LRRQRALAHVAGPLIGRKVVQEGEWTMLAGYSWLVWIIIGGIAGAIAKLLMPGRDPGGCLVTIILGIAGALLAGWIGHAVGWYRTDEGAVFLAAIVGAFVLLLIYRLIVRNRA
jgi:uncharacterized membrane protein YeaQ/YmgE (transglycosylase-associated protein family)